jgi:hypothetical protein
MENQIRIQIRNINRKIKHIKEKERQKLTWPCSPPSSPSMLAQA